MIHVEGDHYTFWSTRRTPKDVVLRDQFHEEGFPTELVAPYLGNPAVKRHQGTFRPRHPEIHLLGYSLMPDQPVQAPDGPVVIRNQFTGDDGKPWYLGEARLLLVPAFKWHDDQQDPNQPPPLIVDHYVCYEVRDASAVDAPIDLEDQFGRFHVDGLKPVYLGVPADKNDERRISPCLHLAIYAFRTPYVPEEKPTFSARDQFARYDGVAQQLIWLGVPSFKEWKGEK